MKEGLYEIVAMRRSGRGKWVFTARPITNEISFECDSDSSEEYLFKHSREVLWLRWDINQGRIVLHDFAAKGESDDENR